VGLVHSLPVAIEPRHGVVRLADGAILKMQERETYYKKNLDPNTSGFCCCGELVRLRYIFCGQILWPCRVTSRCRPAAARALQSNLLQRRG